jgi:uncharacterized protein (DUF2336 family)
VLAGSTRLTTSDLAEIAQAKGHAHLLAISGRDRLEEPVTDVLLSRGNREVAVKLAENASARFSEAGFSTLVDKAEADDGLTEAVGLRLDIPPQLLRELLRRATDAVRAKIVSLAPPQMLDEIQRALADIADAVGNATAGQSDLTAAERTVGIMETSGKLNENDLMVFVEQHRSAEVIVSLARLSSATSEMVSGLMTSLRNDGLLVICKAARLTWRTVEAILRNRHSNHRVSEQVIKLAGKDYASLSVTTAQRTLRFMQVRATVK